MLGIGGPTFIGDWAKAVGTFAHVVGITAVPTLPNAVRRISGGMGWASVAGIDVLFVRVPRFRPTRWFWRLNAELETRRLLAAARLVEAMNGRINLIHSHFYAAAAAVPNLAKRLGVPFVHTEHTSHLAARDPSKLISRAGMTILKEVFSKASCVMLVGQDQLVAIERLGLPGRLSVIGNPIDSEIFEIRQARGPRRRLISVGDLVPRKRQGLILTALAQLGQTRGNLVLDLVGSGPEEANLRRLTGSLDLDGSVNFHGRLSRLQVAGLLAQADLYIHAAEAESFGVAIVEGLLSGLPVVTTRCGGVSDLLTKAIAVVVDDPEPVSFARAIDVALDSDGFADAESIAAWAEQRFSLRSVGKVIEMVYQQALE